MLRLEGAVAATTLGDRYGGSSGGPIAVGAAGVAVPIYECRGPSEAMALALLDELIVGKSPFVSLCAGLVELRLGALALGLLLGDPRAVLGSLGTFRASLRLLPMLVRHAVSALLQLAFAACDAHPRRDEHHRDQQDDNYNDDGDDDSWGHGCLLAVCL